MSQTSTVAASSQPDALMLAPTPARGDVHGEWLPDKQQPSGSSLQVIATPVLSSLFAHLSGPTYGGGTTNAGSRAGFGALSDSSLREF